MPKRLFGRGLLGGGVQLCCLRTATPVVELSLLMAAAPLVEGGGAGAVVEEASAGAPRALGRSREDIDVVVTVVTILTSTSGKGSLLH